VQMCYPFEMLQPARLTAASLREVTERLAHAAPDAWPCWAYSNHDVTRHMTRWQLSDVSAKAYTTLLMCQRGSVCLYQGEELGLPEAEVAYEDLQDPYGIEFWPEYKGRDGCRTPMVWEASNTNGGFSDAKPWLPVATAHLGRAVAVQEQTEGAMLHHYRAAIALRHAHPALARGEMGEMEQSGDVVRFIRRDATEEVFCCFNMGPGAVEMAAPDGTWGPIGGAAGSVAIGADRMIRLGPWECCLAMRRTD